MCVGDDDTNTPRFSLISVKLVEFRSSCLLYGDVAVAFILKGVDSKSLIFLFLFFIYLKGDSTVS